MHTPVRPSANPAAIPARQPDEAGQPRIDRCQGDALHRADRSESAFIDSQPRLGFVTTGAAAATSALCAVGHDTPNSRATLEAARLLDAISIATRCRSRSVTGHAVAPGRCESQARTQRLAPDQAALPPPRLDGLPDTGKSLKRIEADPSQHPTALRTGALAGVRLSFPDC
jgi:hypothetical protein